jgi:hypothetical protein
MRFFFNQPKDTEHKTVDNTAAAENILESDKTDYDFGTISMKNGKVKTSFKIKNPTTEPMLLSKLYTTCMCTEASITVNGMKEGPFGMQGHGFVPGFTLTLGPQQEGDIEVVYDPNAHGPSGVGTIERSIIVEGKGNTLATLNIKATVTP